MAARTDSFDLGSLQLSSGEGRSAELTVPVDPLKFGGETLSRGGRRAGRSAARRLPHDRVWLRAAAALRGRPRGPVHALPGGRRGGCGGRRARGRSARRRRRRPALALPGGRALDLRAWARDALALALPAQIVCREDCLGLCAVCGANLNDGPRARARARARPALGEALRARSSTEPAPEQPLAPASLLPPWRSPSNDSPTRARNKRRSQHKISAPALAVCPRCGAPRIPHRVCG